MAKLSRRKFLGVVVVGAGVVVAGSLVPGGLLTGGRVVGVKGDKFSFRAVGGLPQGPFPSFASYVIEGTIDLQSSSGAATTNVFAGPPEAMSNISLPGLSRTIRITEVSNSGHVVRARGIINDRSSLQPNESPYFDVTIDSSQGAASSSFIGSQVGLKLQA